MERDDVRVVEPGDRLGLALEPREPVVVGGQSFGQQLHRDAALEPCVLGLPHHTHPALTDLLDQAVVQQLSGVI